MGKDLSIYPPARIKRLSHVAALRVLDKLARLEDRLLFDPDPETEETAQQISTWRYHVRQSKINCAHVPAIARAFERWGIE